MAQNDLGLMFLVEYLNHVRIYKAHKERTTLFHHHHFTSRSTSLPFLYKASFPNFRPSSASAEGKIEKRKSITKCFYMMLESENNNFF